MPTETTSTATAGVTSVVAAAIASRQPLRYAGYCYDEHSGLYYLSARSYDPLTRQFLSKDPAKDDGEESAYQYCGGDSVNSIDPSGKALALPLVGVGVLVVGVVVAAYLLSPQGQAQLRYILGEFGKAAARAWVRAVAAGATYTLFEKEINGIRVRGETHGKGRPHAHWRLKNGKKGSCEKDGSPHHKGEPSTPPKAIRPYLRSKGFDV